MECIFDAILPILIMFATIIAGWCLYSSIATTMGSNFRIQNDRNIRFSVDHLEELSSQAKQQFPNVTAAKRLLTKLAYAGVLTEDDYMVMA
jgi:hypothetical protein